MKNHLTVLIVCYIIICQFVGCRAGEITVLWRNQQAVPGNYNNILVAAVTGSNDSLLREKVETGFANALQEAGYTAFSSVKKFGQASFSGMDQEQAFMSLCNNGVDAVVTVALVKAIPDDVAATRKIANGPAGYFYNRMWEYRELNKQLTSMPDSLRQNYCWEIILFDLSTLEPHYIVRTEEPYRDWQASVGNQFWNQVIHKMKKDRFLRKQRPVDKSATSF